MIRINLLEEQRTPQRTTSISVPSLPQENLLFYVIQAAIPIIAILAVVGWGMKNKATIGGLNDDIREQEEELKRLEAVIKLNQELERKRDLLRRKIEVIGRLKRNQDVPVRMLDALSKNLAEFLWLNSMDVKDRGIKLSGRAQNEYAISQFLRNLQNSDYFENTTPQFIKRAKTLYDWALSTEFVLPEEREEAAQAAGSGSGGRS